MTQTQIRFGAVDAIATDLSAAIAAAEDFLQAGGSPRLLERLLEVQKEVQLQVEACGLELDAEEAFQF